MGLARFGGCVWAAPSGPHAWGSEPPIPGPAWRYTRLVRLARRVAILLGFSLPASAEPPVWEVAGVRSSEAPERGVVRVLFQAAAFERDDVPGGGSMRGMGTTVGVAFSPFRAIELEARTSASSVYGERLSPNDIQSVGDVEGAAVWRFQTGPLSAGVAGGARAFAGDEGAASYGRSVSPFVSFLAGRASRVTEIHVELSATADRSAAAVRDADALSPGERFAWGVFDGPRGHLALAATGPADWRVAPAVAWRSDVWAGEGAAHRASAGALARIPSHGRLFAIEAGARLLVDGGAKDAARPLPAAFAGYLSLSLSSAVAPIRERVEIRSVEAPRPVDRGGVVRGSVRDAESGEPLLWAIVEVPGALDNAVLTDPSGNFRVPALEPGTVVVRAQKSGYETATKEVTVVAGGEVAIEMALDPSGEEGTGGFEGIVRDPTGQPVTAARATFVYRGEKRTVAVDDRGRFRVKLPPGSFTVTVEADGFATQTREFQVVAGRISSFEIALAARNP